MREWEKDEMGGHSLTATTKKQEKTSPRRRRTEREEGKSENWRGKGSRRPVTENY